MNKKRYIATVAATAVLSMITSIAQGQGINLDVITQDGEWYQEIVDAYEEANPQNSVTLQAPSENYDDVARRAMRASLIGDPPDIVFMGYNQMDIVVDRGIAVDIDQMMGDDLALEGLGYLSTTLDLCRRNGKLYGLPFATSIPIVFYNPELVAEAGGDPNAFPETWDGVFDLAQRIDTLNHQTMGVFFRYVHSGNWSWQALLNSFGGTLMAEDGVSIAFDGEAGRAALDVMYRMKSAGMIDMSTNQARQAFMSGTVGIFFDSSSALASIQAGSNFTPRTAQYPSPVENSRLPGGGNCIVMTTPDVQRQPAALDFMQFATGPIGQAKLVEMSGYVSNNVIANSDPAYLGNYYRDNPEAQTAADASARLTSWNAFPGENSLQIVDVIHRYLEAVINHTTTPEAALRSMVQDVSELLPHV
ncbi:extracellular solute-binding protein [Sinorhizobium medicae]|nr:extracellular solute-binding protein [Sinorhizobium medicae]